MIIMSEATWLEMIISDYSIIISGDENTAYDINSFLRRGGYYSDELVFVCRSKEKHCESCKDRYICYTNEWLND
mgnify:CR=1 FL=1